MAGAWLEAVNCAGQHFHGLRLTPLPTKLYPWHMDDRRNQNRVNLHDIYKCASLMKIIPPLDFIISTGPA
jgi:hypothetical protein